MDCLSFLLVCFYGWINRRQQAVFECTSSPIIIGKTSLLHRRRIAFKGKSMGWKGLRVFPSIVTPDTLLAWHLRLSAKKCDGTKHRVGGWPPTSPELKELIVKLTRENRSWGYTRIQRALANLRREVGSGKIAKILREAGIDPASGPRKAMTLKEVLRTRWDLIAATDFLTAEVWTLGCQARLPAVESN